jgi:hypothetical protein
VVVKVKGKLTVNRQILQRFLMERCSLRKLTDVEGKEKYRIEVSKRFAALEDLDTEVETIRGNIKISAKESLGYLN